jgi:uncharacterized protein YyaL (SSP411 family)
LKAAWPALKAYPQAHMSLLNALQDHLDSVELVIIRGSAAETTAWSQDIGALYAPQRMVFAIPNDAELPEGLAAKKPGDGPLAYLCSGMTCSAPITELEQVARELKGRVRPRGA